MPPGSTFLSQMKPGNEYFEGMTTTKRHLYKLSVGNVESSTSSVRKRREIMENENELDFGLLLQQHRLEIVKSIDTEKQFIRCYLQSKLVLDDDDCERIRNEKTRQDRAAKLLDILSMRGTDAWRHFIDALEFDNPALYEKITGRKADAREY